MFVCLGVVCGIGGWMWLAREDRFQRVDFALGSSGGGRVKGVALLPRPVARHAVAVCLDGGGASGVEVTRELGQFAALGMAGVALDCGRMNQAVFDQALGGLHRYLAGQKWAQSNAVAWVGSGAAVERAVRFALEHQEVHPLLVVYGGVEGSVSARECERLAERGRSAGMRVDVLTLPSQPGTLGEDRSVAMRLIAEHCAREMPPPGVPYRLAINKPWGGSGLAWWLDASHPPELALLIIGGDREEAAIAERWECTPGSTPWRRCWVCGTGGACSPF